MKKILSTFLLGLFLLNSISHADNFAWESSFQGGKPSAENIRTNTDNFDGNLSATDTNVQLALDTLDELIAGSSGDITDVGDCATGACFNGTQGTTLTFNNAGGDGVLSYDGSLLTTDHDFEIETTAPTLHFTDTNGDDFYFDLNNGAFDLSNSTTGQIWFRALSTSNTIIIGDSSIVSTTIYGDVIFEPAGVQLTGDGDGAITFLGLGNGSDEDLTFNFDDTSNEVDITSSTGVAIVDFNSIGVTAGNIIANASASIKNGATSSGVLSIYEDSDAGSNFASFQVPSLGANTVYVLPADDGDASEVLATDGSGNLTWEPAIGTSDFTFTENQSFTLVTNLSADGKFSGITEAGTAGTTLAFGDIIYLAAADSRWELADSSAASTSGDVKVGICVLAAAADGSATEILTYGTIRADANFPALTISAPVHISETAGDVVVAAPTTTDSVTRRLGFAITADSMFFNPSNDYYTHV